MSNDWEELAETCHLLFAGVSGHPSPLRRGAGVSLTNSFNNKAKMLRHAKYNYFAAAAFQAAILIHPARQRGELNKKARLFNRLQYIT